MKNKIFKKMQEYGWNLGDNTFEDFDMVFETHKNFLDGIYDYFIETEVYNDCNEDKREINLNDFSEEDMQYMSEFMTDFLRALNDIDKPKTKEEKIREYIMSRNIRYDLVGEDLLAILDDKYEEE